MRVPDRLPRSPFRSRYRRRKPSPRSPRARKARACAHADARRRARGAYGALWRRAPPSEGLHAHRARNHRGHRRDISSVALPLHELVAQRAKSRTCARALREIREAIDAYKASDEGRIEKRVGESGPPAASRRLGRRRARPERAQRRSASITCAAYRATPSLPIRSSPTPIHGANARTPARTSPRTATTCSTFTRSPRERYQRPPVQRMVRRRGTLIELLVVLAVIATLLTLALPRYFGSVDKSKEAVLKENLFQMRDAISLPPTRDVTRRPGAPRERQVPAQGADRPGHRQRDDLDGGAFGGPAENRGLRRQERRHR